MIKGKYQRHKIKEGMDFLIDLEGKCLFSVKFASEDIVVFISVDSNLNELESQLSYNLGYLMAFYLNKFENEFNIIFKDCKIKPGKINFFVFADSYSKRSKMINSNLSNKVSPENPLYFTSSSNGDIFEILVIYSLDHLDELFTLENNNAEQFIVKKIIIDLYSKLRSDLKEDEILGKAQNFIEKNIPNGPPGFTFEKLTPINERVVNYGRPLKLSEYSKKIVRNLIENFLKYNLNLKPGKYADEKLKQILNELFKFLQSELEKGIKSFNRNLLYDVYTEIEFLRNYRESMEISLGIAQKTYTEYDVHEEKAKLLDETVKRHNVLQHLLETILKVNSFDGNTYTGLEYEYLEVLSSEACYFALVSDFVHYKVIPYEMIVYDDYSFDLDEKKTFDGDEYILSQSKKALKYDFVKYNRAKNLYADENNERGLGPEYDEIEKAFEQEFGFKYTDLLIITFALGVDINPSNNSFWPMVYINQKSLIKEIKNSIIDDIPTLTIKKVLNFISLPYETFRRQDTFLPNLLRMNENRFSIKPLIKLSNKGIYYLYGVLAVHSTCGIYAHKIDTGRFPYQLRKGEVTKALKKMEKRHNKKLEIKVDNLASDIFGPENVISNLNKFKNIDKSLPNKPDCGEIDCIVVDKSNKILYVLEAKDVMKALSPKELRNEFNKFFDPNDKKNYSKKLMKKVNFVSKHLKLFLEYFNVSDDEGWSINHAFVTYEVHLSAFHKVNNIEFVPLTELEEYFKNSPIK